MKNIFKNKSFIFGAIVVLFSLGFFFAVSSFNFTTQDSNFVKWLSPDETANYILTKLYGQEGRLSIFEKYNLYVDDVMRPRSFRSDHGEIKPVSFLGIILIFGTIVKFTTFKIIPYLTPLFASIGIIYYYFLIKKLFNRNIALVSAILLAFFPVYIYYSARSMFHNVLFTVFLVIGLYYSLMMVGNSKNRIQRFKDSKIQRTEFKDSKIQRFKDSRIQGFKDLRIQRFKDLKIQRFKDSKIQGFKDLRIQGFKEFWISVFTRITRRRDYSQRDCHVADAPRNDSEKDYYSDARNDSEKDYYSDARNDSEKDFYVADAPRNDSEEKETHPTLRAPLSERGFFREFISFPKYQNFLYLLYSALAGLFVGLAVIVRTSELMWLAPLFIVIWIFNFRKVGLLKLLIFLGFFLLALLPMFYYNQILYSSPLLGGYSEMNQSIINIKDASTEIVKSTLSGEVSTVDGPLEKIKKSIFYFGLQPRQSFLRLKYYFVYMFPWIFWPALLGGLIFLYRAIENVRKKYFLYIFSYFLISFILIIYYGSWGFTDNPDPNSFTIGNSYTRYWLPVYLGAIPLVSIFVLSIGQFLAWPFPKKIKESKFRFLNIRKDFIKWGIVAIFLSCVSLVSIQFVLHGSEEGLIYVAQNQVEAKNEARKILNLTESNSVIITLYHDKLIFPERKVVVGLFDDKEMLARYSIMVDYLPVYYYNFTLPEKDIEYLNTRRLAEFDLRIEKVEDVTGDFTLYRIVRSEKLVLDEEVLIGH